MRLAHGWRLAADAGVARETVRELVRPAVRAIPATMARRLRPCRVVLKDEMGSAASRWTESEFALEIEVAVRGCEAHDVALELLRCVGQALWEKIGRTEEAAWLRLLGAEVEAGVSGEIDEDALNDKRRLFRNRASARSLRRLQDYARAAFASTAAEYVHCLWHDVTVRTGEEHLPAPQLRRRLEMMAAWFPPDRGVRLFASSEPHETLL